MPQVPLPYPADIMIRERAILINVEAIRMIITKDLVQTLPLPACLRAMPPTWCLPACTVVLSPKTGLVPCAPQAVVLSVPDPADYEGPMRWVFPTEKVNSFFFCLL